MQSLLVTERALRDRRRSLLGWSLGLAAYCALMASMYPSIRGSEIQKALRDYPEQLKAFFGGASSFDFSTSAAYLNVELFSLVVPALLIVFAIGYGAGTIAGEQDAGTLDLLLSYPVTRTRVALEKALGLAGGLVLLGAVVAVSVEVTTLAVGYPVGLGNALVASLGSVLVALFTGLLAMLVGAFAGRRGVAIAVATTVFAASYLVQGLAGLVSWLKPLRVLSPLYHATGSMPLRNGLPVGNYAILAALCIVTVVALVAVFTRRDLVR